MAAQTTRSRSTNRGGRSRSREAQITPRTLPPLPTATRSSRRANLALAAPLLLAAIGCALLVFVAVALGAALVGLAVVIFLGNLYFGSPKRVLAAVPDGRTAPLLGAELSNLVEGVCLASGLSVPALRILDDDAPNALVLGASESKATLICTTGLLNRLDRIELEGLVAHELAHLKRREVRVGARATVALGLLSRLTSRCDRMLLALVGYDRAADTDQTAATMTRYPPGLLSALEKLAAAPTVQPAIARGPMLRLTGALWCAPLVGPSTKPKLGELDLEERIAALAEL